MQAVLVFLAAAAVVGARSARTSRPLARHVLIFCCILLTLALTSRRVI